MGAAFLGASQARCRLCGSGFAETLAVFVARTTGAPTSCQAPPDRGDFWYPSMSLYGLRQVVYCNRAASNGWPLFHTAQAMRRSFRARITTAGVLLKPLALMAR